MANVHPEYTQDVSQGFVHVHQGKSDNAVRNIPLTSRTCEMLLARRELMVGPKDAKPPCGDLRFVFPGKGHSGHLVTVQHAHEKAAKECVVLSRSSSTAGVTRLEHGARKAEWTNSHSLA